jgi:hypothetical protein
MSQPRNYRVVSPFSQPSEGYQVPAHPSGLDMRTQLNAIVLAILGDNCGPAEPPETYPGMMWGDTTALRLKRRTNANDAWIEIGPLDDFLGDLKVQVGDSANKVSKTGDIMTGRLTLQGGPELTLQGAGGYSFHMRPGPTGMEWVNHAYNAVVATMDDAGSMVAQAMTVRGNLVAGGSTYQSDGNIWMTWYGNYLSAALDARVPKRGGGNYGHVVTDTGNSITINWGPEFQMYTDGYYQGNMWHSGNFDPNSKISSAECHHNSGMQQFGPISSNLYLPNPWVCAGANGPGNAIANAIYLYGVVLRNS